MLKGMAAPEIEVPVWIGRPCRSSLCHLASGLMPWMGVEMVDAVQNLDDFDGFWPKNRVSEQNLGFRVELRSKAVPAKRSPGGHFPSRPMVLKNRRTVVEKKAPELPNGLNGLLETLFRLCQRLPGLATDLSRRLLQWLIYAAAWHSFTAATKKADPQVAGHSGIQLQCHGSRIAFFLSELGHPGPSSAWLKTYVPWVAKPYVGLYEVLISFINGTMGHIDLMQNTLLRLGGTLFSTWPSISSSISLHSRHNFPAIQLSLPVSVNLMHTAPEFGHESRFLRCNSLYRAAPIAEPTSAGSI